MDLPYFPWQLRSPIPDEVLQEVTERSKHLPQCGVCDSSNLDELLETCRSVDNDHPSEADCLLLPRDGKEVDKWLRRVLKRDALIADEIEVEVTFDDIVDDNPFGDTIVTDGPITGELEAIIS